MTTYPEIPARMDGQWPVVVRFLTGPAGVTLSIRTPDDRPLHSLSFQPDQVQPLSRTAAWAADDVAEARRPAAEPGQ